MRTTGAQPARLYDLAKVHKNETPSRPVLSIPGSSYQNLNKFLTPLFEKLPGTNIETSSLEARKKLETLVIDENEQIISLDVKSFHTNVPVSEAIEIALRRLYMDTTLNFRSCAPLQHKKNIIEGTVHGLLRCTSDWKSFDEALKLYENIWKKNQYPESWLSKVVNKTLEKKITQPPKPPAPKTLKQPRVEKVDVPMFFLQCRGNLTQWFREKIRKVAEINVIYTTRKLKTCLPTLKSAFDKSLKSHVVYEITCCGCNSTYVGQTCRPITTRIIEHQKADSPVGQRVSECCGTAKAFNW